MDARFENRNVAVVRWTPGNESLMAPGQGQHYLPCDGNCGALVVTATKVVSIYCEQCWPFIERAQNNAPEEFETCADAERYFGVTLRWDYQGDLNRWRGFLGPVHVANVS
jgi:hypothetical protein